jgi:Tol biopolymer transport system component
MMDSIERTSFPLSRDPLDLDYHVRHSIIGGWWSTMTAMMLAALLVLVLTLMALALALGRDKASSILSSSLWDSAPVTFTQYAQGAWDIYALDTARGLLQPLVVNFANDVQPVWSSDGRRLLFASDRGTTWDLYTLDIELGAVQQVEVVNTNGEFNEDDAVWSSDETAIAMTSYGYNDAEVVVMNLADNSLRQVTNNTSYDGEPTWSPDGSKIAFVSNRTGSGEIYVTTLEGGATRQLTHHPAWEENPSWSPDHSVSRIAFVSSRDGHFAVYVIDLNFAPGAGLPSERRVTPLEYTAFDPAWTADGRTLIFAASLRGHSEIYAIDMDAMPTADGYPMHTLTGNLIDRQQPAWWP